MAQALLPPGHSQYARAPSSGWTAFASKQPTADQCPGRQSLTESPYVTQALPQVSSPSMPFCLCTLSFSHLRSQYFSLPHYLCIIPFTKRLVRGYPTARDVQNGGERLLLRRRSISLALLVFDPRLSFQERGAIGPADIFITFSSICSSMLMLHIIAVLQFPARQRESLKCMQRGLLSWITCTDID